MPIATYCSRNANAWHAFSAIIIQMRRTDGGAVCRGGGYTVVELLVSVVIFTIISAAVYGLLVSYIQTASFAQLHAVATSVADQQMERLRALPYNSLAVQGGSIVSSTYIPATQEVKRGSWTYVVTIDIQYVDDAYDGCFNYPTQALRDLYCRNGPPKTGVPADSNPRDYKIAQVTVKNKNDGRVIVTMSSHFSARVAEVAGNTSMVAVKVIDMSGNGIAGATVRIVDSSVSPAVDQTTTTDDNGMALFMDATPDSSPRYVITASKSGFSTLSTIAASGALVPNYPNVTAIAQNVSSATLVIDQVSSTSLQISTVDSSGAPVANVPIDIKGGIKLYTDAADDTYSYNQTVTTDATGNIVIPNLVPGDYRVCYAATNKCAASSYYAAAVQTTVGPASWQPFPIPAGNSTGVGMSAMQAVRVVVTTNSAFPRVTSIDPTQASASATGADTTEVTINGANLSGASVSLVQGGVTIAGTVSGTDSSSSITRVFNVQGVGQGAYDLRITTAAGTVVQTGLSPGVLGGFNVLP